jgi:hypothetical protein
MSDENKKAVDPVYEEARERIRAQRARPPGDAGAGEAAQQGPSPLSRFFRRGPWENLATVLIAAGVIMLMQPFALSLFTYSFITILTGTVMFIIVSHFPE